MEISGIGLFDLAQRRLGWLEQRQTLLARNIANLDTPGYRPVDSQPFTVQLDALSQAKSLATTSTHHLSGTGTSGTVTTRAKEVAPDGNAVSLEEQLSNVADTQNAQALTSNLYMRYTAMMRTALGRS